MYPGAVLVVGDGVVGMVVVCIDVVGPTVVMMVVGGGVVGAAVVSAADVGPTVVIPEVEIIDVGGGVVGAAADVEAVKSYKRALLSK